MFQLWKKVEWYYRKKLAFQIYFKNSRYRRQAIKQAQESAACSKYMNVVNGQGSACSVPFWASRGRRPLTGLMLLTGWNKDTRRVHDDRGTRPDPEAGISM
ncbi:MAG: hypothetical protein MZU95_14900 [Desulfomicrobium escambiense]|nr:hypothetical protein [Desulfomicrobium escambiense]